MSDLETLRRAYLAALAEQDVSENAGAPIRLYDLNAALIDLQERVRDLEKPGAPAEDHPGAQGLLVRINSMGRRVTQIEQRLDRLEQLDARDRPAADERG